MRRAATARRQRRRGGWAPAPSVTRASPRGSYRTPDAIRRMPERGAALCPCDDASEEQSEQQRDDQRGPQHGRGRVRTECQRRHEEVAEAAVGAQEIDEQGTYQAQRRRDAQTAE